MENHKENNKRNNKVFGDLIVMETKTSSKRNIEKISEFNIDTFMEHIKRKF